MSRARRRPAARRAGLIALLLVVFTAVFAPAAVADPSPTPAPGSSASPTPGQSADSGSKADDLLKKP
jgi:hypothetical protein